MYACIRLYDAFIKLMQITRALHITVVIGVCRVFVIGLCHVTKWASSV